MFTATSDFCTLHTVSLFLTKRSGESVLNYCLYYTLTCFFNFLTDPDKVKNVQLHLTAHNVITVNCGSPQEQNGPRLEYIVKLSTPYGSEIKTLQSRTCLFMFDNLGYLTTYTVQVCIHALILKLTVFDNAIAAEEGNFPHTFPGDCLQRIP